MVVHAFIHGSVCILRKEVAESIRSGGKRGPQAWRTLDAISTD